MPTHPVGIGGAYSSTHRLRHALYFPLTWYYLLFLISSFLLSISYTYVCYFLFPISCFLCLLLFVYGIYLMPRHPIRIGGTHGSSHRLRHALHSPILISRRYFLFPVSYFLPGTSMYYFLFITSAAVPDAKSSRRDRRRLQQTHRLRHALHFPIIMYYFLSPVSYFSYFLFLISWYFLIPIRALNLCVMRGRGPGIHIFLLPIYYSLFLLLPYTVYLMPRYPVRIGGTHGRSHRLRHTLHFPGVDTNRPPHGRRA